MKQILPNYFKLKLLRLDTFWAILNSIDGLRDMREFLHVFLEKLWDQLRLAKYR